MIRFVTLWLAATVVFGQSVPAKQRPNSKAAVSAPAQPAQPAAGALSVEDVANMLIARVPEEIVLLKLRKANHVFELNPDQLIALRKAGASSAVLRAMLDPKAEISPNTTATPAAPPPPGSSTTAKDNNGPEADANNPDSPHAQGIYLLQQAEKRQVMIPLSKAGVQNTRQKGVLATASTFGIKKARLKSVIPGVKAEIRANEAYPVFYFYLQGKTQGLSEQTGLTHPNQFTLQQVEVVKGTREITAMEYGAGFGAGGRSGGDIKGALQLNIQTIRPGVFKVVPSLPLEPGEYAFSTFTGTILDFGVDTAR